MPRVKVVIVACDMTTAYGLGVDACWDGLISGKSAIRRLERFATEAFKSENAAAVSDLILDSDKSLVMQMLESLFKRGGSCIPSDAALFLATTTGEIDILEKHVLTGKPDAAGSRFDYLLEKVRRLSGVERPGVVISAACASSNVAVAHAASMIANSENSCALIVATDSVSEFVFSGFSVINALCKNKAMPFDKQRDGLSLGEASGFLLLMSESRALKEKRTIIAEVAGWGSSNDANHITGPSRDGEGLRLAIDKALHSANISSEEIGCISAHGTGTIYNDSMEMKAFKAAFDNHKVPTYSIKGGTGHTLGAAGLVETIVAVKSLKEKIVPPTVNLSEIDDEAQDWVSKEPRSFNGSMTLSTNSGFGGINAALVLRKHNG